VGVNEPQSRKSGARLFLAEWWKDSRKNLIRVLVVSGVLTLFGARS
jgi:hypothetical protein